MAKEMRRGEYTEYYDESSGLPYWYSEETVKRCGKIRLAKQLGSLMNRHGKRGATKIRLAKQ